MCVSEVDLHLFLVLAQRLNFLSNSTQFKSVLVLVNCTRSRGRLVHYLALKVASIAPTHQAVDGGVRLVAVLAVA